MLQILEDRSVVRYPCEIVFDAQLLLEGEFAHPVPNSDDPKDGYKICVHPFVGLEPTRVPYLVLVDYGPFASADDAETFGSTALGISKDDYYETLCAMADERGAARLCE